MLLVILLFSFLLAETTTENLPEESVTLKRDIITKLPTEGVLRITPISACHNPWQSLITTGGTSGTAKIKAQIGSLKIKERGPMEDFKEVSFSNTAGSTEQLITFPEDFAFDIFMPHFNGKLSLYSTDQWNLNGLLLKFEFTDITGTQEHKGLFLYNFEPWLDTFRDDPRGIEYNNRYKEQACKGNHCLSFMKFLVPEGSNHFIHVRSGGETRVFDKHPEKMTCKGGKTSFWLQITYTPPKAKSSQSRTL